jgi:aminopeptidase YwaD
MHVPIRPLADLDLAGRLAGHVDALVAIAPHRPPGSPANRRATEHVIDTLTAAGWPVETLPISATWWEPGPARLIVGGAAVPIDPPPFCRPGREAGPLVPVQTLDELEALDIPEGAVLVLAGDLAVPVFPRAFPFVTIPEQVRLLDALERCRPAAVLAVVAEARVHEPVFEDPDLPFAYATVAESAAGGFRAGAAVELIVGGRLATGGGVNVSAGVTSGRRAVVSAHVDSKVSTPGALDNGAGVAVLLALAEQGTDDLGPVELVFFNGEDHYAAPGEQAWLAARDLRETALVVNVDGAGLRGQAAAVSTLGAGPNLERLVAAGIADAPRLVPGVPWFESDHAVFAMQGIPSVAITSDGPFDELKRLAHAADDSPERLDPDVLASVVAFVRALLESTRAER